MLLQLQKKDNVKIPVSLPKMVVLLKSHCKTLNHFALLKGLTPLAAFASGQVLTSVTRINELPPPPLYVTTITPAKPPGVTGGLKLSITSPLLWG